MCGIESLRSHTAEEYVSSRHSSSFIYASISLLAWTMPLLAFVALFAFAEAWQAVWYVLGLVVLAVFCWYCIFVRRR